MSGATDDGLDASHDLRIYMQWGLIFPTFLLGLLTNAVVLLVCVRNKMLVNRIDWINAVLLLVCLCWSLFSVTQILIWGVPLTKPAVFRQLAAAGTSLPIDLLIGANVVLAIERYCISLDIPYKRSWKWFLSSISVSAAIFFAMMYSFITSPCTNEVFPDKKPQLYIWLISASVGFLVGFTSIVYFYTVTHRFIAAKLASSEDHNVDTLMHLLHQKALRNSIATTASVLICYLPESIAMTLRSMRILDESSALGVIVISICFWFMAGTVLVTPGIIVYFSRSLSNVVRAWRGMKPFGVEEEEEMYLYYRRQQC